MNKDSLNFLCCPRCHGDLTLNEQRADGDEITLGLLRCLECKKDFKIVNGIPDFLLSEFLNKRDKKWMSAYDSMARGYDIIMSYVFPLMSLGLMPFERYKWVKALQVRKGAHVLDVSTGTGANISLIAGQIGPSGKLTAMDISRGMLTYAKTKMERRGRKNAEFHRANASYLPYKDDVFDAVIHVGGINTFGEKKKALYEMVRVAKREARIVVVDEGLAPERQGTFFGKYQLKTNSLYFCRPPTKLLPRNSKNVRVTWKVNFFWPHYIMQFDKE
jgi:ubiquinone/menaquinone biosynthesis C-methylase UbiE